MDLPISTAFAVRASHRGLNERFVVCVNSSRIAGSSGIAGTAATIIVRFFV